MAVGSAAFNSLGIEGNSLCASPPPPSTSLQQQLFPDVQSIFLWLFPSKPSCFLQWIFIYQGQPAQLFFFFLLDFFFWWNQCREQFYITSAHCTALVLMSPVISLTFILMEKGFFFQSSNPTAPFFRAHLEAQRVLCCDNLASSSPLSTRICIKMFILISVV